MESVLANLEHSYFKNFLDPSAPTMVGPPWTLTYKPPQYSKAIYDPAFCTALKHLEQVDYTLISVLTYYFYSTTCLCNSLGLTGRVIRGGSRAAATPNMECFVIIVNGFQPLTIITKCSILDVAAALDPPLVIWVSYPL